MAELHQLDKADLYTIINPEDVSITRVGPESSTAQEASESESYPHQVSEDVTPEELKKHYELNNHMYHALLKPHVEKLLAEHVTVSPEVAEAPAFIERSAMEQVERKLDRIKDGEDVHLSEQDATALLDADKLGIIFSHEQNFTSFSQTNAEQFFKARSGAFVLYCREKFPTVSDDWLFEKSLFELNEFSTLGQYRDKLSISPAVEKYCLDRVLNGSYSYLKNRLASHPEVFQSLDLQQFIDRYDEHGLLNVAVDNLPVYDGVDQYRLVDELLDREEYRVIIRNINKFSQVSPAKILEVLPVQQYAEDIIGMLDVIDSVPPGDELLRAILPHYPHPRNVKNLLKFYDADRIQQLLVDGEEYDALLAMPEKFAGVDWNEIIQAALREEYEIGDVLPGLSRMVNLNRQTAERCIAAGYVAEVMQAEKAFAGLAEDDIVKLAMQYGRLDKYRKLMPEKGVKVSADVLTEYEYPYGCKLSAGNFLAYRDVVLAQPEADRPELFRKVHSLFGGMLTQEVFAGVYALVRENTIPEEAARLGVTETGWEGAEQLRDAFEAYRKEFLSARISTETEVKLLESALLRDVLMKFVSYRTAGFGRTDEESFQAIIRDRVEAVKDERAVKDTEAENYPDSAVYHVELLKDAELTDDVITRYETLHADIKKAIYALDRPQGFKVLINDLHDSIQEIIDRYDRIEDVVPKTEKNPERRIQYMRQKQAQLRSYLEEVKEGEAKSSRFVLNSPADVRRGFSELEQYDELHGDMRSLLYAWAIKKNPQMRTVMESLPDEPTIHDVAKMRDFIDHLVLQETYGDYFTDKKAANRFKKMSSTRSFDDALANQQRLAERSAENTVQFVASKGLMLELSGQLASVCWADKYQNIGAEFPNFSALIMKRQPGTPDEELIGAAMLIDTFEPSTAERVVLLRGVNPTDDFINHADVAQFYDALTDYVKKIAEAEGSIPAVVIDDHAGGAGSNRQVIHAHLQDVVEQSQKIIVDAHMTTFNHYNPSQMSYRL